MTKLPPYKTWIEISKEAVKSNVATFRSLLGKKTKLFAVVKSNAYGHGLETFSALADKFGADGFCVDSVIEGRKLRAIGVQKPVIVLGPTLPELFGNAAAKGLTLTISNIDFLKALVASKARPTFHLKIDTGMHRQGFYVNDLPKVVKMIQDSRFKIQDYFKGAYTHFAAAKDVTYPDYTLRQIKNFQKARDVLRGSGFNDLIFHAAATGGTILYPQSHFDLVRVGIGLYGYWPLREAELQHGTIWKKEIELKPVLSWWARPSEVKFFEKGDFIGYDLSEKATERMMAAIIPIGYWHGFPRSLSGKGEVLISGRRSKVLGRVSMNLIIAGLPGNSRVGNVATIIGKDGSATITAEEIAMKADTISYEILTRLNPLIKKIVV